MTKLQKLLFAIGVRDEATTKVGKIQKSVTDMTSKVRAGFRNIGVGTAGLVAVGYSLNKAIQPAREFNAAMASVKALGVDNMGEVQRAAGKFSQTYGGMAVDFVNSSYDIASAIDGLTGKEVAAFTTSSALLAKASKSNMANMTSYMGIMHGIFEREAAEMGKGKWAEGIAAKSVWIANTFRSSGESVSQAFSTLGAKASVAGHSVDEQFAVLGMLQATMGGAESGTKYKAFLSGVAQAQEKLGLSFTDSHGRMLGTVEILEKIKGKFGGDKLTADQQRLLSQAFGSKVATDFIDLMITKTGKLSETMETVKGIDNLNEAKFIARQNTDAFDRLSASVNYFQVLMGQKMLPTVEKWANSARKRLNTVNEWIEKYPRLASVLGEVVTWLIALTAVAAALTLVKGIGQVLGLTSALKKLGGMLKVINLAIRANPIGFLIWLLALCIIYWDQISAVAGRFWNWLKSSLADTSWGQPILWVMEKLENGWNSLVDLFTDFSFAKRFRAGIILLLTPLEAMIRTLGHGVDLVPGMSDMAEKMKNFKVADYLPEVAQAQAAKVPAQVAAVQAVTEPKAKIMALTQRMLTQHRGNTLGLTSLERPKQSLLPQGGMKSSIMTTNKDSRKSIHIGEVINNFTNAPNNMDDFANMLTVRAN